MSQPRRFLVAFVIATILLALVAPISEHIGAESPTESTPSADEVATEVPTLDADQHGDDQAADAEPTDAAPTELPTDVPTDIPAAIPTDTEVAPTEIATEPPAETPTEVESPATTIPTNEPATTATATATPKVRSNATDATGALHVQVVDADGNALPQTCLSYGNAASYTTKFTTVCDGANEPSISSHNDANADGFIDIDDVPAGDWQLKGSDASGVYSVEPLPVFAHVDAGKTTDVTIWTHSTGGIAVTLRGVSGTLTTGCAELDWDWIGAGNTRLGPYTNRLTRKCDADDGTQDGVVHFNDVPSGSYWVWGADDSRFSNVDFYAESATVVNGQTSEIAIYKPSSEIKVLVTDAVTGDIVYQDYPSVVRVFDNGYESAGSVSGLQSDSSYDTLVGPGTYYIAMPRFQVVDGHYRPLYVEAAIQSEPFTLGIGDSITITLKLQHEEIQTPTPGPTEEPTNTPTATATTPPNNGKKPECWASLDDNANRIYKLDCDYYVPGELVNVYWDHTNTKPIASFTANSKGSGTVWVSITKATAGQHRVVWRGTLSTKKLTRPVTVEPLVHLSVDSGPKGTIVTISATGYGRNEAVAVFWAPYNRDGYELKAVTSRRNGMVVTKIKIPNGEPDVQNQISLINRQSGNEADATFTITAPKTGKSKVASVKSAAKSAISAIDIPGL